MTRSLALSRFRKKQMGKRKDFGIRPSVTGARFLDDWVEVSYAIYPPYSTVNEMSTYRVYYSQIPQLPEPPEKVDIGVNERIEIQVPQHDATLVFIFDISRYGLSKLHGPYLKRN